MAARARQNRIDHINRLSQTVSRRPKITRSRILRANETEAERKLWRLLRGRRFAGLKWHRQHPIGRYIADFACLEKLLIVECDGCQHAEYERDLTRDAWLKSEGYTVVRFWNHEILQNPISVTDTILARAGLPFWFETTRAPLLPLGEKVPQRGE